MKQSVRTLAYTYMDMRDTSCLITASGHHWEKDGNKQKPEPLDKSDDYPQPFKMLILSTVNYFQCLRSGWSFALYIASRSQP